MARSSAILLELLLQRDLPYALRFYLFVPAIVVFIVVTGVAFTLPPGPLCDEGMVLFMEGGCDWGQSNIFFFSKLGALVGVNFAFIVASRRTPLRSSSFVPHLLLLCWLGWALRTGGRCDTYYRHPNGSLGQMALEIAAFGLLGLAVLSLVQGRPLRWTLGAMVLWNAAHVGLFQAWLSVTDHWTWAHSWLLCVSLLGLGALSVIAKRWLEPGTGLRPSAAWRSRLRPRRMRPRGAVGAHVESPGDGSGRGRPGMRGLICR